jgi:hypothetical protein
MQPWTTKDQADLIKHIRTQDAISEVLHDGYATDIRKLRSRVDHVETMNLLLLCIIAFQLTAFAWRFIKRFKVQIA